MRWQVEQKVAMILQCYQEIKAKKADDASRRAETSSKNSRCLAIKQRK